MAIGSFALAHSLNAAAKKKKHLWRSSSQIRRPPTLTLFTFTSRSPFLIQKPNRTTPHSCLWRAVLITSPARSACSERALPVVMNVGSC